MRQAFTLTWEPPETCTAALRTLLAHGADLAHPFVPADQAQAFRALLEACPTTGAPAARGYLQQVASAGPDYAAAALSVTLQLLRGTHRPGREEECTCADMLWDLFLLTTEDRLARVNDSNYWTATEDGRARPDVTGAYLLVGELLDLADAGDLSTPDELTLAWDGATLAVTIRPAGTVRRRRLRLGPVRGPRAQLARRLRDASHDPSPGRLVTDLPETVAETALALATPWLPDPTAALAELTAAHAALPPARWQALTRLAPTWHASLADLLTTSADVLT